MERPVPLRRSSLNVIPGKTRGKRGDKGEGDDATKKKSKKKGEKPEPEVAPEFVVKPRRQFIDDGAVAKFKASFDGPASTQIFWSKDGTVLIADDHYKIYEADGFHHLEVLNVTSKDNGVFTVTALNPIGSDSATAELEVFERPKLLTTQMPEWEKPLEDIVVRQGDTAVEITCSSKDLKNPSVRWFHNDQEIFSGFHTRLQHEGQLVTLTIKEIKDSDAGQIKCVMTGVNGELESACSVVVRPPEKMEAPVFVKELHDMEVEEGDKLELDVKVKGTPPVEVFWFHNNQAITRHSPHFLLASLGSRVHTLTIPRATRDCSGEFVCEAYNAFGDTDTFCLVHVKEVEDPEAPSFVTRPLTLIAQEGESVTLTCRVRGQPAPTVLWERQGVVISPCHKYQMTCVESDHSLTITLLDSSDAGLYVCHLHSATGDASHTCELRVEESHRRPRALSKSLREPLNSGTNWDVNGDGTSIVWAGGRQDGDEWPSTLAERSANYKGGNPRNVSSTETCGHLPELSAFYTEKYNTSSNSVKLIPDPTDVNVHTSEQASVSRRVNDLQNLRQVNKPPVPKPRSLTRDDSQSSTESRTGSESFEFPTLKPVAVRTPADRNKNNTPAPPTDFRSVLKPRAANQPKPNSASEQISDFRSVLSKPKLVNDKDFSLTVGGFPRTDTVGLELRNLQMERTSRNVVSRSNEPKFGINSIVASHTTSFSSGGPSSSGSHSHRDFSYTRPSPHVNSADLRLVNKNLDALEAWDGQPPGTGEPPLSARGGRGLNHAAPSYSPSSCSSASNPSSSVSQSHATPSLKNEEPLENYASFSTQPVASSKAVPRYQPYNKTLTGSSSGTQTHLPSNLGNELEQQDASLPPSAPLANMPSIQHEKDFSERQFKTEDAFVVTGVSKNSKGSLRLAGSHGGSFSSEEDTSGKQNSALTTSISITNKPNTLSNLQNTAYQKDPSSSTNYHSSSQPVNSTSASEDQQDIPPPLPSLPPPSLPPTEPSASKAQAASENDGESSSTKCISYVQFTPSSSSKPPDTSSPYKPVVFNFTLPTSSTTTSSVPAIEENERSLLPRDSLPEETSRVSDSSHNDSDDVFTEHLDIPQANRRGSFKTEGSVFAWEKIPEKSPERTSPLPEAFANKPEAVNGTGPALIKKTRFKSVAEEKTKSQAGSSQDVKRTPYLNSKSVSSSPKTPPPSSKSKSVSSNFNDRAEFRHIKLKSTGINVGGDGDLKRSKFMSTSTESLFFNVKLKPVAIRDNDELPEESSLAKNSWSIKAKSKSSGDLLREVGDEKVSRPNEAPATARDAPKLNAGFSEKLSAFEGRGSKTDRSDYSRKPNFTVPKKSAVSKFISEANRLEKSRATPVPVKTVGVSAPLTKDQKSNVSAIKTNGKRTEFEQPKFSSTLPRNHKTQSFNEESASDVVPLSKSRPGARHSVDVTASASSRMETVPSWVREKALGKRSSLTAESKASTLPMSSGNNLQSARERITKLKENPNAPKTPRRFKRDKPKEEDDRLSMTVNEDRQLDNDRDLDNALDKAGDVDTKTGNSSETSRGLSENAVASSSANIGQVRDDKNKPGEVRAELKTMLARDKTKTDSGIPEWMQRRNLRPVEQTLKQQTSSAADTNKIGKETSTSARHNDKTVTPFSSLISRFNQNSGTTSAEKEGSKNLAFPLRSTSKTPNSIPSRKPYILSDRDEGSKQSVEEEKLAPETKIAAPSAECKVAANSSVDSELNPHFIRSGKKDSATIRTDIVIDPPQPVPTDFGLSKPNERSEFSKNQAIDTDKINITEEDSITSSKELAGLPLSADTKPTAPPVPAPDSSALNNQTPLRNTTVRPAWKKQRSLRHIPIYPIHDNELSPRYEPFLLDDSESTASVSSTSSEASTVTNDSGYYSKGRAYHGDLKMHTNEDGQRHSGNKQDQIQSLKSVQQTQEQDHTEDIHDDRASNKVTDDSLDYSQHHDQEKSQQPKGDNEVNHHHHQGRSSPKLICEASSVIAQPSQHDTPPDTNSCSTEPAQGESLVSRDAGGRGAEVDEDDKDCNDIRSLPKESSDVPEDISKNKSSTDKDFDVLHADSSTNPSSPATSDGSEGKETKSPHSDTNAPTRQSLSLSLKNRVAFLEPAEGQPDVEPGVFPRRRSKFMEDYQNSRRGSNENQDVVQAAVEKSNEDTAVLKQPLAKRPSDLDIVPRWKRTPPISATTLNSSVSESSKAKGQASFPAENLSSRSANGLSDLTDLSHKTKDLTSDVKPGEPPCVTSSAPEFSVPLTDAMTIVYGSKATLRCTVTGYPSPEVQWLLDRQLLEPCKTRTVSRDGDVAELIITETFAEHEGVYTCQASNPEGSASTSCALRLAASEKTEGGRAFEGPVSLPPRIVTLTPKAVSLTVGSPLTLTATFAGEPTPSVTWSLAGRELVSDDRVQIEQERDKSTLTIAALQRSDCGKMSVCVSSSIGTDQSSVNICIEDVPDAPVGKPQVYDLGRASASLSWCGPASSGGNNVTHYSIEARTLPGGHTWEVVVRQCKELTCHILDLKPCTSYEFRVRAANRHGLGPPSEPSERVTTIDLFTSPSDYESDGFGEVFTPSIEYRQDELPFEPRHVEFNTKQKFEDVYELDKEVGKGKFGTVYRCRHREDGKTWAAKLVKCRPRDKAALRMEVEIMNKLRHPKLLMLWDAFESDRQMVLVMEYVGAGELFERVIGEDFVLTERDCTHFLRQICEGVAYMHEQCVLHLDLKPENILCMAENSNRIKIIDFGLARHHNPGESTKVLFGTPEFIAPEVINYDEIGFATDMWSVGVICYVLLSGLSPFLGDNDTDTLSMVTVGDFDFDDEAFDEISDQAKDFISKLLVKRKEKRMLTSACLKHSWLNQDEVDGARYKRLNTERLKRFMVRRKWLKTGNAVLAVSRLLKTTSLIGRLGSRSSSEENLIDTPTEASSPALPQGVEASSSSGAGHMAEPVFTDHPTASPLDSSRVSPVPNSDHSSTNCADGSATVSNGVSREINDRNNNNNSSSRSSNTVNGAAINNSSLKDTRFQEVERDSLETSQWSGQADPKMNPSTSSHCTESSTSRTSSLASPVDLHQHPSGLRFSKLMTRCKACRGDAARFDVVISGASLPLRLYNSDTAANTHVAQPPALSVEPGEILVTWYVDGEEIVEDENHHMTEEAGGSPGAFSLIIRSVGEEHEGEYSCRAYHSPTGEETLLCCRAELSVLNV